MKAEADAGEILDILMAVMESEARKLLVLTRESPAVMSSLRHDSIGRMAVACAKIEKAMRAPYDPRELAKLPPEEIQRRAQELQRKLGESRS